MVRKYLPFVVLIAAIIVAITGCSILESGKGKWKMFLKEGVYEDPDTYVPKLDDIGDFVGMVDDASVLIERQDKYENSVVALETYVYVSSDRDIRLGIDGDDGVGLYVDENLVCSKPNAEDPMVMCDIHFTAGWHRVDVLVYNGPLDIYLAFDKKLSDLVDEMDANHR